MNRDFRILYSVFETNLSSFIANFQIRRISSSLKKTFFFLFGRNLRVGKISNFNKITYVLSIFK